MIKEAEVKPGEVFFFSRKVRNVTQEFDVKVLEILKDPKTKEKIVAFTNIPTKERYIKIPMKQFLEYIDYE